MGQCCAPTPAANASREGFVLSKKIDGQLQKDHKRQFSDIVLLLLGAGESGKSTVAKQMKVLYLNSYSDDERLEFAGVCRTNVLEAIHNLCFANLRIGTRDDTLTADIVAFSELNPYSCNLTPERAVSCDKLWKTHYLQETYEQRFRFVLFDNAKYFLDKVVDVASPEYVPSVEDILRTRVKTTTIIETKFCCGGVNFRMVDVGGQRSQRRKWIHVFENVTALIFVTATSEYDQRLEEDTCVNRLLESLELFEELVNSVYFKSAAIILFLNKTDILQEKLQSPLSMKNLITSIKSMHTSAKTAQIIEQLATMEKVELSEALTMIQEQFIMRVKQTNRYVYTHNTCATNTDNIRVVFEAVREHLLKAFMDRAGF